MLKHLFLQMIIEILLFIVIYKIKSKVNELYEQ